MNLDNTETYTFQLDNKLAIRCFRGRSVKHDFCPEYLYNTSYIRQNRNVKLTPHQRRGRNRITILLTHAVVFHILTEIPISRNLFLCTQLYAVFWCS